MSAPASTSKEAVEAFLYLEARLADESRYDEWLALWTEDACYWVPANSDDYDPNARVSIIYDDHGALQDRIARLKSGAAWAQEPQSRMRRSVTNIELGAPDGSDDIRVLSNFVLGELRRGRQTVYFAQQRHRLRQTAGGLRMAAKTILLVNNNEPIHSLSFLL